MNGFAINTIDDVDKLIKQLDAECIKSWGTPLNPLGTEFILHQCSKHVKTKSDRIQIDNRIRELHKKTSMPQLLPIKIKTESERTLEAAQQKRDEKARALGYDISDDDGTDKEPTEKLKKAWKKRERENEEMNRK